MPIKLIFFGGVGTTTGANIMLEFKGRKILVDCGLLQGVGNLEQKNFEPFKYNPKDIDLLLITHAHMDHIGKVPKLARDGFGGKIISTIETKELAKPMLEDALKVMRAKYPNKALFDENDIKKALSLWQGKSYGEKIELFPSCLLEMQNAGHILGSAILNITTSPPTPLLAKERGEKAVRISFTGDLGNSPSPLLPDTEFPKNADYLIMESVYGDRNHESKKERKERLKEAILGGIEKKGTIVIPTFSVERTQVLLYEINNMIEDRKIPQVPVFLDSPLAIKVTDIYKKYQKDFKESIKEEIKRGDDIFVFPGLRVVKTAKESKEIEETKGAKIILAGSGMSEGGRILNHESRILNHAENTLILVGYQAVGTLGRLLEDGAKEVIIDKKKVKVRAKTEVIKGYSSHKDSEHLLEFVEKSAPRKAFVIMGEPKSSLFLCQRIREYLNIDVVYPEEGREYGLK